MMSVTRGSEILVCPTPPQLCHEGLMAPSPILPAIDIVHGKVAATAVPNTHGTANFGNIGTLEP